MAFKLKSIHDLGLDISPNPETAAKTVSDDQMTELLSQINVEEVEYESWQKVDVNGYKKMRIERVKKCRAEFIEQMRNDYASFLSHVERVRAQYKGTGWLEGKVATTWCNCPDGLRREFCLPECRRNPERVLE